MKKTVAILMATSLFAVTVPAMATEHDASHMNHGDMHMSKDMDCAKDCDLLLKNCAQEVDSIQQRIERIKAAIKAEGAKPEHAAELRILNNKLKEANATLKALQKPGH